MPQDPLPAPAERSRFFRHRIAWIIVAFALACIVLHRPILRGTISTGLNYITQREGLKLQTEISGNVLSELSFSALSLIPVSKPHPLVDEVRIGKLRIRYSLLRLVSHGPAACIQTIHLEHAQFNVHSRTSSPPTEPFTAAPSLASLFPLLVSLSTSPISTVNIKDFNVNFSKEQEIFSLKGAEFSAEQNKKGVLRIEALQIGSDVPVRKLEARTRYANRIFVLEQLQIGTNVWLKEVQLDASHVEHGLAEASVFVTCGEGRLQAHFTGSELARRFRPAHWKIDLQCDKLDCNELAAALGWNSNQLPNLTAAVTLQGDPSRASSWTAEADAEGLQPLPHKNSATFKLHAALKESQIKIKALNAHTPKTQVASSGTILLPEKLSDMKTIRADVSLHLETEDLSEWIPALQPAPKACFAAVDAKINLSHGAVQIESTSNFRSVFSNLICVENAKLEATLVSPIAALTRIDAVAGNAVLTLTRPVLSTPDLAFSLTEATAALTIAEGALRVWNINLKDAQNVVRGEVLFPMNKQAADPEIQIEADCPSLSAAQLQIRGQPVTGSLQINIANQRGTGPLTTTYDALGTNLNWGAFGPFQLRMTASSVNKTISAQALELDFGPQDHLHAQGEVTINNDVPYKINATLAVAKLEKMRPLFAQLGLSSPLGGALNAIWKGEGTLANFVGEGEWSLQFRDANWDRLRLKVFDCSGHYSPDSLTTTPLRIETQDTRASAQIRWSEGSLQIQNIKLEQWGYQALTGELTLPLTHGANGTHWVENGALLGKIQAIKLDLSNLCAGAGKPGAMQGTVEFLMEIGGTPLAPTAQFNLSANRVQIAEAPKFTPLSLNVSGSFANGMLQSDASLISPLGAPVEAHAKIPIPIAALLRGDSKIADLAVSGKIFTHSASLKIMPQLWSGLRQISGTASLDAEIHGTFGHPNLTGKLWVECPVVHFSSDRAPALADVIAKFDFTPNELRISELKADLGGGNLQATGSARFEEPANPTLNFSIKAKEVLILRNRELLLRLNGDLALRGPWSSATLSGHAEAVNSRWQKDIEVLPLTVVRTGFPKEQPQTTGKPWFTFQRKPFSNWKFSVNMSTTPGDPILVRGNRLRGTADAEIRLEGTGAAPTLDGAYRTDNLVASLPFARMDISHGRVWYSRDLPFQPNLDFSAEAEVRNNRVRLYLWGPASAPSITARSEPPIPEIDLLTLLTTGSLPTDATDNSQALAGRAAALLFQEFSDKVLPPNGKQERFSALRRFGLDVGALNSRTGHQESRLSYRITNDLFLIGEVGADGDFAGRVRYVIRFR